MAISILLPIVPPQATAQHKEARLVRNKRGKVVPQFFASAAMKREEATWSMLLRPHVPSTPLVGPIDLVIVLVYPHVKSTPKRDVHKLLPKITRPDTDNAIKAISDVLAKMRFITDDAQVARSIYEKWTGPDREVGIRIRLQSLLTTVPFLRGAHD